MLKRRYTMAKYTMKKVQGFSTLAVTFSVTRTQNDFKGIVTDSINVLNKALVMITMTIVGVDSNLQIEIKMKINDAAEITRLPITIVCEEFREQIVCSREWGKTQIKVKPSNSCINRASRMEALLVYNFELNIDVTEIRRSESVPVHLMVMSQLSKNADFTDCQLLATDGSVPVHKSVLSVHSDVFKNILMMKREESTGTQESTCFSMKEYTVENLQHLKDYMYLGVLPDMGLETLLLIASKYSMDTLKSDCIVKLGQTIKPEDLNTLVEFACQNNIPDLIMEIIFHIMAIVKS